MHVLVTGATGFIGKHLVPRLLQEGFLVRCLARPGSRRPESFKNDVEWVVGDLSDPDSLFRACKNMDLVIHLAGITKSGTPDHFFQTNTAGTENLINAVPVGTKIIFISSQAAVGPSNDLVPLSEHKSPCPVSDYGRSKLLAEQLFLQTDRPIKYTIIRPAIVYGPEDRESLSLFRMAKYHLNPHVGIQKALVNIVYISDLVKVVVTCIYNQLSDSEIFHINDGNDTGYTQNELISKAAECLDTWIIPLYVPKILVKMAFRLNAFISGSRGKTSMLNPDKYNELAARGWVLSSRKAREVLDYQPNYTIESGFKMTTTWYRENRWL